MRRRFTAAFKAQVVQEILRGEKTIAQIAAKHKIHPNMIGQWKAAAIKGLPTLFDEKRNAAAVKADHDAEIQELFEQIGRLSIENAWLKKKSGLERDSR
jgi:transposase-like protein